MMHLIARWQFHSFRVRFNVMEHLQNSFGPAFTYIIAAITSRFLIILFAKVGKMKNAACQKPLLSLYKTKQNKKNPQIIYKNTNETFHFRGFLIRLSSKRGYTNPCPSCCYSTVNLATKRVRINLRFADAPVSKHDIARES